MVKYRITPIGLIWVAISLTASSRSENIPSITHLDCLNDFQEKMFCFWDVTSNSNCSKEFTLWYIDFEEKKEKCLDLGNEQFGGSVVPNKCVCNIPVRHFVVAESYEIAVESHGEPVANTTVHIGSTIKPRAPSNVQVTFQKDHYGVVHWDTGYKSTFIKDNLSFQVQIISKQDRKVIIEDTITHRNPEYHFSKRQLERGEHFVLRVRAKPVQELQGAWGEWSSEAEWRNDYSLTILDQMDIVIPIACIVMLCLTIFSYVCLTRYKKKWWDTIPNPANSLIVKRKRIQEHQSIPDRKHAATKSCGRFFSRIVKAHKSKCDQLTQHDTVRHYIIDIVSSDGSKFVFEPKTEEIERWVEMHPKRKEESKPEQKAEDLLLEEDLSIANIFFSILHDSASIKVNTFENLSTELMDCSILMDGVDKQSNLNISGHQTLEYRNYNPDDSPVDCSSNIDAVKIPPFNQWLDNEIGCIPFSPQVSIKEDWSKQSKGDPLTSPGYNSFANAMSEARNDFVSDTSKTFCLDNFSKSMLLDRTDIYEQQLSSKGILCFCSHGNSCQPNIKPESGQIILQCHESKSGLTSIGQVSGYQSFDQAVQENEPELGCHMSGYKSFDQAVWQGDETFLSEMNQYQSFDRAVQEYCPGSGYHLSGYKCFDQAVRQGDETSVHEVNTYQSFDQAVQQGDETFVSEMNQYESFDQAVRQGDETFVSEMNQYQSFDQAVRQGDETFVSEMNQYQSFDQAVRQGDETFVSEMNQYQSFDQAVRQGDETFVSEMNQYQSVDQGVRQGDEIFVSEMNQYPCFDQGVRQGDEIFVSEMNQYQSFDQGVWQGDEIFVSEMNQYQSFDQGVRQGDETFVREMNQYQSFDRAVQENCPGSGCHLSGYKSFDQTVQEGNNTSVHEVNVYQSYDQAVQKGETLGTKHCSILDSGYKPFESLIGQNNYLDKNACMCKNGHLTDKNCETNTDFDNRREYRLLSSDLMELIYSDIVKSTKGNDPSISDKPFNALKIAGDTNNYMALKHEGIPLALTFDICEHLRNLENIPGHKVPLNNLENGTNLVNEAIFLCHLVSFAQKQLTFNKNVTLQKCPSTTTFENMPLLMPLYDLDIIHSSQTTKHLLIQQNSYDKDGNSYMKIK